MRKWLNHQFESSCYTTPEFTAFAKDFRAYLKRKLPNGARLISFHRGHFYISGYIERDGKFVYFSTFDVRDFPNKWYEDILIRTAENERDFYGGANNYTNLKDFTGNVERLLKATHLRCP